MIDPAQPPPTDAQGEAQTAAQREMHARLQQLRDDPDELQLMSS